MVNFKKYLYIMIISLLFSLSIVFADTNGVWNNAEDIRGGIFGLDELDVTTYFKFISLVQFDKNLEVKGIANLTNDTYYKDVELDARYINENQANSVVSSMIVDSSINSIDVNSSQIQLRVSSSCVVGEYIRAINENGTVICGSDAVNDPDSDPNNEKPLAGLGVIVNDRTVSVNSSYIQRRVSGTCAVGQYIRVINEDGTVICGINNAGADNLGNHIATQTLNMNNNKISNVALPTVSTDVATKAYVDAAMPQIGRYSSDCSDWNSKNWPSRNDCLQDGRWHLVQSLPYTGGLPNAELLAAHNNGADIKVIMTGKRYIYPSNQDISSSTKTQEICTHTLIDANGYIVCLNPMRYAGNIDDVSLAQGYAYPDPIYGNKGMGVGIKKSNGFLTCVSLGQTTPLPGIAPVGIFGGSCGPALRVSMDWYIKY